MPSGSKNFNYLPENQPDPKLSAVWTCIYVLSEGIGGEHLRRPCLRHWLLYHIHTRYAR